LLRSCVPLLRDLGLTVDWKVIGGDQDFFHATKALHNALQGDPRALTVDEQNAYRRCIQENAATLDGGYDFIVIHDPQPAGLLRAHGKKGTRWVWRCHIDTSEPNPDAWRFLAPYLEGFDAAVFTMSEFAPPDLPVGRVEVIAPAIDPLSPKNIDLDPLLASQILDWIGMEIPGRLITQVSRFDQWKDPLGVIDAYRLVREQIPEVQLALVGSMALDDPEGWDVYRQVSDAANHDPLIHVYTNLTGVGNVEVNAFQRLSDVVVQKSIRRASGWSSRSRCGRARPSWPVMPVASRCRSPRASAACSSGAPRSVRRRCSSCWTISRCAIVSGAADTSTCASASCCHDC
jgi:trehalose synthase